jgi:hypothetical protein
MNIAIRPVTPEDSPRLEAIRRAAFAPVFASFRAILGDEIYNLTQAREEENAGISAITSESSPIQRWWTETANLLSGPRPEHRVDINPGPRRWGLQQRG